MSAELALTGGMPVRKSVLPYGHHWVDEDDIAAVVEVLRSDWLTTGPRVDAFEQEFARFTGAEHAVAVSTGTAALHACMHGIGLRPNDEVIVPAITFAATANCAVYQGGVPVVVDVRPDTLLIDADSVARAITSRTRAIVGVDFGGQPCDYDELYALADVHGLTIVADACHSLGAHYRGRNVGTLADVSAFSFHPVKNLTTGEGGMVVTSNAELAARVRAFRNHGMTTDFRQREERGSWFYEIQDLGYNYRLPDILCALGSSQLRKLEARLALRRAIAARYDQVFAEMPEIEPLHRADDRSHAFHVYVVTLDLDRFTCDRATLFRALRAEGIGVNVHYIPVHLHPYYRDRFGLRPGQCPVAEAAYERMMTLPLFAAMTESDVDDVIAAYAKVRGAFLK